MTDKTFRNTYLDTVAQAAAAESAAYEADEYIQRIQHYIDKLESDIVGVTDNDKSVAFAKGDAAEPWHAQTYNIDAARRDLDFTPAETPRVNVKDSPDALFGHDHAEQAQLKYYGDADSTARAFDNPGYEHMVKVGASDLVPDTRQLLLDKADRIADSDPDRAAFLRHTAETTTDHLDADGAQSQPLTLAQAEALVADARDDGHLDLSALGMTPDQVMELQDGLRELGQDAGEAFAVAASIQAANYVITAIQRRLEDGSLTPDDLLDLAASPATAAAKSTFTATVAGGLTLAAASGVLGDAAQALDPTGISVAVVMTVNSTLIAIKAARGEISWDEAGYQMAKSGVAVTGGLIGASIGTLILPGIGTLIGSMVGVAVTRLTTQVSERVVMALAVSNGWTYFGIVAQDYTYTDADLREMEWETVALDSVEYDSVEYDSIIWDPVVIETVEYDEPIKLLHRGMIGVRRVGYV